VPSSGRLFDTDPFDATAQDRGLEPGELAVRVRPDVSGLDAEFDYVVPADLVDDVEVGTIVRVELNGRNVAGWVTALHTDPPPGVALRSIQRVSSVGPSADLIELARWAAYRWSGRIGAVLRTASPPRHLRSLPTRATGREPAEEPVPAGVSVVRIPPAGDLADVVAELAGSHSTLVVTPRVGQAAALAGDLRRRGLPARLHPRDWAAAAGRGGVILGARSAVWARVLDLDAIVVIDEHDEALQEERNPTWHARDVAIERAARARIPCYLVSPSPSLAALQYAGDRVAVPSRSVEREGWPVVELVDRRNDEPGRGGLFSGRVADLVRSPGTVLAVLNRKGRAIVLACTMCGELVRTEDGDRLMVERDGVLVSPSTGEERPLVCATCGATSLKRLRLGVTRAAEELAALAGEPVDEITAGVDPRPPPGRGVASTSRVVVGTEAALHQLGQVGTVVFLDFDQELLAPRYRSAEQAMALLVLAARLVGPRSEGGRIVVQTRSPDHRVLRAAVRADPGMLASAEQPIRESLGWPPFGALAEIGGDAAGDYAVALRSRSDLSVLGPRDDGRYLLRATSPEQLAAAIATTPRPQGRVRVAVDPPRA
jgi:primosomal protein N' (replication factor Y)